jgi:hypothetical protein
VESEALSALIYGYIEIIIKSRNDIGTWEAVRVSFSFGLLQKVFLDLVLVYCG